MRYSLSIVAALALSLGACGTNKISKNDDANTVARAEKFSELPKVAILAVPVDAKGKELPDQAELRVTNASVDATNGANVAAAFNAGSAPAKVVSSESELDGDSSTQAWRYWRGYWRGYYNSCYNYCYWGYRPQVYYGGYNWNYGWGGYSYYSSYRYYTYNSFWY